MRLKITQTNFTTEQDWLFQLIDTDGNNCFIMDNPFYKRYGLKSPVTKKELDSWDKGYWISATVAEIEGKRIIVELI